MFTDVLTSLFREVFILCKRHKKLSIQNYYYLNKVSTKNVYTLLTYKTTGTKLVVYFPLTFRKGVLNVYN